jgi:hypothetical protein
MLGVILLPAPLERLTSSARSFMRETLLEVLAVRKQIHSISHTCTKSSAGDGRASERVFHDWDINPQNRSC